MQECTPGLECNNWALSLAGDMEDFTQMSLLLSTPVSHKMEAVATSGKRHEVHNIHEYTQHSGKGRTAQDLVGGVSQVRRKGLCWRPTDKKMIAGQCHIRADPHMTLRVRFWLVTYSTVGQGTHVIENL